MDKNGAMVGAVVVDVDMVDPDAIEEGEIEGEEEETQCIQSSEATDRDVGAAGREPGGKTQRRRARKKNKKKGGAVPNVDNINRFVIDTCRQLKERKSYLIWNAVGCLGVSAVRDIVKEVDAIQACGGQMTADGRRPRNGGGILWNILKTREPKAYKEIMTKGKEFEKQFWQQPTRRTENSKALPSQKMAQAPDDHNKTEVSEGPETMSWMSDDTEQRNADEKCISVLNRIRVPVAYDDLIGEDAKDESF